MPANTVLIDVDGVLTTSWRALPGAPEALKRIRDLGLKIAVVTNTTAITREKIHTRLTGVGFEIEPEEILTAPSLAAEFLRQRYPGASCALVTNGDIAADLHGVPLVGFDQNPEVVLLGGAGPQLTYEMLNRIFSLADNGVPIVALHRNLYWRTDDGLQLDTGAYLAALELATGQKAHVIGKPARSFFETALRHLDSSPFEAVMIGDDIENDVLAAQDFGIRGVLVRTGKFTEAALRRASPKAPDVIINSFADAPRLFPQAASHP